MSIPFFQPRPRSCVHSCLYARGDHTGVLLRHFFWRCVCGHDVRWHHAVSISATSRWSSAVTDGCNSLRGFGVGIVPPGPPLVLLLWRVLLLAPDAAGACQPRRLMPSSMQARDACCVSCLANSGVCMNCEQDAGWGFSAQPSSSPKASMPTKMEASCMSRTSNCFMACILTRRRPQLCRKQACSPHILGVALASPCRTGSIRRHQIPPRRSHLILAFRSPFEATCLQPTHEPHR